MSVEVTTQPTAGDMEHPERLAEFVPTPERLSQYLEMNIEETSALLTTVEGRQKILDDLREHEMDLREVYPELDFDRLQERLDLVGETLKEKMRYLESATEEEKKGIVSSAWESVKNFGKNHPITMTILVTALSAAAVAAGFYVTGNWELMMTQLGVDKVFGATEAAQHMIEPIAPLEQLPGEGVFAVPPGAGPANLPPGVNQPL